MAGEARRTTTRKPRWLTAEGMRSANVKSKRLKHKPRQSGCEKRQRSGSLLTKLTFVTNRKCRARVIKRRQRLLRQRRKPKMTTIESFKIE